MKIIEPKNQRSCRIKEAGTGSVIEYVDFSASCVRTCLVGERADDVNNVMDVYNVMDIDTGEIFKIGADMVITHYANATLCLDMESEDEK